MLKAISTYIYVKERLHPGLLDKLVSGGAQAIEIFGARQHLDYANRKQHVREIADWFRTSGVPLHSVSREAIGGLIGYVGQNPFVFAGTIAENIAYGCEGATESDIRHAAERACLHEEILAMPGGYAAVVAERGQNLSGGQRQRIALARVFLKNPPILVLDEGTSALDNISERRVQEAITEARADRTVILVAHRLTTLRDADRIFVFDEGRLVEEGPYGELVHRGGTFAELVHCAGSVHGEAAPVL